MAKAGGCPSDPGQAVVPATRAGPAAAEGPPARGLAAVGAAVVRWAEMVKFVHSVFALPFALAASFLAARAAWRAGDLGHPWPAAAQLGLILVCMVSARSVAMTFNRIADAGLDALNPRTAGRAIPAGTVSTRQAWFLMVFFAGLFVSGCAGFLAYGNVIPLALALPVLAYLCAYSYTKRFTRWSHYLLGSAIGLSPVAAWAAIHPTSLGWPAVVLAGAVTLWIGGFDIIYACQDMAFDRAAGLHSLPARLGPAPALWIARLGHAGTVALLIVLAPLAGLGWIYLAGVALVAGLLIVEHLLVSPRDFSRVNLAFFTVNGVISLVLGALAIADTLIRR